MPLYEYQCDACAHPLRSNPEVLGHTNQRVRSVAARSANCCPRPPFNSRARGSTSPTTVASGKTDSGNVSKQGKNDSVGSAAESKPESKAESKDGKSEVHA